MSDYQTTYGLRFVVRIYVLVSFSLETKSSLDDLVIRYQANEETEQDPPYEDVSMGLLLPASLIINV